VANIIFAHVKSIISRKTREIMGMGKIAKNGLNTCKHLTFAMDKTYFILYTFVYILASRFSLLASRFSLLASRFEARDKFSEKFSYKLRHKANVLCTLRKLGFRKNDLLYHRVPISGILLCFIQF